MRYMIRAEIANNMALALNGDLFGMMYGVCAANANKFYLLNPRPSTDFQPIFPALYDRNSRTKLLRARVDILGAPGIMPAPFETGGADTAAFSGATFTVRLGAETSQITVPRFQEWFDAEFTFPAYDVSNVFQLDLQDNLLGSPAHLYCLYDAGNMQDYYKGRLVKGLVTLEIENSFGVQNV